MQSSGCPPCFASRPAEPSGCGRLADVAANWFENHTDICAQRRALIRDDKVYFFAQNKQLPDHCRWTIFDLAAGKPTASTAAAQNGSPAYFVEDRLLHFQDGSHNERALLDLFAADDLRRLCEPWKPPHETATGYEVFLETPCVEGRLFLRTMAGQIRCFDLNIST